MHIFDLIRQEPGLFFKVISESVKLKKRGKRFVGICPFHEDDKRNPSLIIDCEKGLFHCFGCGVGGDIFTFVAEKENMEFPDAVRYLAKKYNIPFEDPVPRGIDSFFVKLGKIIEFKSWHEYGPNDESDKVFYTELIEENTRAEPFRLLLKPGVSLDLVLAGLRKAMEIIEEDPSILTEEHWDQNKYGMEWHE